MKRSRIDMSYTSDLGEAIAAMRKRTISLAWLAALTGLLALTSCDSATNSGMGTVRLHLTASGTSTMINAATLVEFGVTSATVTFSAAELMPGHEPITPTTSTFELVGDDPDVLDLDEGVTALLGAVETLGEYEQLRLIVSEAEITVALPGGGSETFVFDEDAHFPSGQQTGIKVNFGGPIQVGEGAIADLLVVLDVGKSFVFQGPPDNPRSVSFKPVIHAATESWGYIEGDVTLNVPPGAPTTITVEALRTSDNLEVSQVLNVAALATVAHYHLGFLPAGEYIVTASADTYTSASSDPVTVGTVGVVIGDLALVK